MYNKGKLVKAITRKGKDKTKALKTMKNNMKEWQDDILALEAK